MAEILLVENEPDLASAMSDWLTEKKHHVHLFNDEKEALSDLRNSKKLYELVILDLEQSQTNEQDVCRMYRECLASAPILMVGASELETGKNNERQDNIGSIIENDLSEVVFKFGADDYIDKPFQLKEFSLRVCALLRKEAAMKQPQLRVRNVVVDVLTKKVTKSGEPVHLAPKEYALLEFLLNNADEIFSHDQLLQNLWSEHELKSDDTVRGHIKRLRRKLDEPAAKSIVTSIYGFGYKLESDLRVVSEPGFVSDSVPE